GAHAETWFRRFASNGTSFGDRVVVRTAPDGYSLDADAAYDSHGNLFVVWSEYDSVHNLSYPARARAYDAAGEPLGPDFIVADERADAIRTAALRDDCFANAWYGNA